MKFDSLSQKFNSGSVQELSTALLLHKILTFWIRINRFIWMFNLGTSEYIHLAIAKHSVHEFN